VTLLHHHQAHADPEISRHTLKRPVSQTSRHNATTSDSTDLDTKRIRIMHHASRVGLISDSIFRFLIEDDTTQSYLIRNNFEKHISLNRGRTAQEVVKSHSTPFNNGQTLALTNLLHHSAPTTSATCIMKKTTPLQTAETITEAITKLNTFWTS